MPITSKAYFCVLLIHFSVVNQKVRVKAKEPKAVICKILSKPKKGLEGDGNFDCEDKKKIKKAQIIKDRRIKASILFNLLKHPKNIFLGKLIPYFLLYSLFHAHGQDCRKSVSMAEHPL